jgi:predicted dehydrogenase
MNYTIAAGAPPAGTWITDPDVGGGRIIGEMCHFVDLCTHIVGAAPVRVHAQALGRDPERDDSVVAQLGFGDGSVATIQYLAQANAELPKERFEVSCEGRTLQCDNFRTTTGHGANGLKTINQDKGQEAAVAAVVAALRNGGASPITLSDIEAVSLATFGILESIETGRVVEIAT